MDLTGWQLVDSADHFKQLSGPISPKSYRVFNYTSGWLNNSGDAAAILDPSGKGVEKYSFGPSERGFAWAKDATSAWRLTITPTPGSVNKITGSTSATANTSTGKESTGFASTGIEPTLDFLTDTFQSDAPSNFSDSSSAGKVAGASESKGTASSVSTLLIAAGIAFLATAAAWPFLEKRKLV